MCPCNMDAPDNGPEKGRTVQLPVTMLPTKYQINPTYTSQDIFCTKILGCKDVHFVRTNIHVYLRAGVKLNNTGLINCRFIICCCHIGP